MSALSHRWSTVRRVLAIRPDNIGDVLMTSPALSAIRDSIPSVHLALLTSPSGAALRPHIPMLDEVIAAALPWVKGPADASDALPGRDEMRLIERLRSEAFDAAVVFTTATQSALPAALACRLAGIPLRLAHCRENPYALLTDWRAETDVLADGMRHEVQRQLDLVATVGWHPAQDGLVFHVLDEDRLSLRAKMPPRTKRENAAYIVVHVGATAPSRRYPAARFGVAAGLIAMRSGHEAIFTGDAGEAPLIDEARACMGSASHTLAGRLALGELAALIADAQLLVSNNTGPAHIAAAVGTPVVDLYALTNPQHTPWRVPSRVVNHDVPCRHCLKSICPLVHHDCLARVEPETVAQAALELLDDERIRSTAPVRLKENA